MQQPRMHSSITPATIAMIIPVFFFGGAAGGCAYVGCCGG